MQFKEVLLFSQIQKFFNIHYYLYCISQFSLTICYNVFFYLIRILSWYKFIASSANEALRVEFSTSSNFTWGSAQTKETGFLGSLPQTLRGAGAPRKPRKMASWEVYLKLYVGLRANQGNRFLGEFTANSTCGLRANSGTSRTRLHTATGAAFPAPGRAPINRQSPQRASSRLERGALWRSLAQPCARNPRNVSV